MMSSKLMFTSESDILKLEVENFLASLSAAATATAPATGAAAATSTNPAEAFSTVLLSRATTNLGALVK